MRPHANDNVFDPRCAVLLRDPMLQAAMRADGVDDYELLALLHRIATVRVGSNAAKTANAPA